VRRIRRGYAELLEQPTARVRATQLRAAQRGRLILEQMESARQLVERLGQAAAAKAFLGELLTY